MMHSRSKVRQLTDVSDSNLQRHFPLNRWQDGCEPLCSRWLDDLGRLVRIAFSRFAVAGQLVGVRCVPLTSGEGNEYLA